MTTLIGNPFYVDRVNELDDFNPAWDVERIFGDISHSISQAVNAALDASDQPDPANKIHCLVADPGLGKTHLLGRLHYQLQEKAEFVFIGHYQDELDENGDPDLKRVLRRRVTENFFRPTENHWQPVSNLLAHRASRSFSKVLNDTPRHIWKRHASLDEKLKNDPLACLSILDGCQNLTNFQRFAQSFADRHVGLASSPVLRALAMGWSPQAANYRSWLLGEIPDQETCGELNLPGQAPSAFDVLAGAVTLTSPRPIVLCFDQVDSLLRKPNTLDNLTSFLMSLLQEIPRIVIVLTCFEDGFYGKLAAQKSFHDRVKVHELRNPIEDDPSVAGAILHKRLETWREYRSEDQFWPFDKDDVEQYSKQERLLPRVLLRRCRDRFEDWQRHGQPKTRITLTKIDLTQPTPASTPSSGGGHPSESPPTSSTMEKTVEPATPATAKVEKTSTSSPAAVDINPAELFRQRWEETYEKVRDDKTRRLSQLSPDRLHRQLAELLRLFVNTNDEPIAGVKVSGLLDNHPLGRRTTGNQEPYHSGYLSVQDQGQSLRTVWGLMKQPKGQPYVQMVKKLKKQMDDQHIRGLLVHMGEAMPANKTGKAVADLADAGVLRLIPLEEYADTMCLLDALLMLLDEADNRDLILGDDFAVNSIDDCRDLACKNRELVAQAELLLELVRPVGEAVQAKTVVRPAVEVSTPNASPAPPVTPVQAGSNSTPASSRPKVSEPSVESQSSTENWAEEKMLAVVQSLSDLGVSVRPDRVVIGPRFARLRVRPQGRTTIAKVRNRAEDLKIRLDLKKSPIINSQAGAIGIDFDLPASLRQSVTLESLPLEPDNDDETFRIPLGVDVANQGHWIDLANSTTPHVLVAGTTGSGKSVFLLALLAYLARLYKPQQVQFALVDPKRVTFPFRKKEESPYLYCSVGCEADDAMHIIDRCVDEMESRYRQFENARVDKLTTYTQKTGKALPRLVAVFDEFADLMVDKDVKPLLEAGLKRIAAKGRAAGVHLILATQRPEAQVITPLIRSNLPARVCLAVSSRADSNLILDDEAGYDLLGQGDMFVKQAGRLDRVQSPFINPDELVEFFSRG